MKDKTVSATGGLGFSGLLGISFIVLKLLKIINWSWWWVLSPLWIPYALALAILLVILIGVGLYFGLQKLADLIF